MFTPQIANPGLCARASSLYTFNLGLQASGCGFGEATTPPAGSHLQQSPSVLFFFSLRVFLLSLHSISTAPAVWRSLRCQESLSPRPVLTGNSRADCSRLIPQFPQILALLGFFLNPRFPFPRFQSRVVCRSILFSDFLFFLFFF